MREPSLLVIEVNYAREWLRSFCQKVEKIIFFGNFKNDDFDLVKNSAAKIIVCDINPETNLLDEIKKRGEYRFFHAPFKAKLWIFENNRKQQYSILELEDKSILVNFDLGEKLGFRYENYPLLHLNEQISAQIKCDSSNSPILSNAKYRNRRNLDLISEEFTMLLYEWINDGYMKPLFPPISDNVITEWNKKIFHNFVTYGKSLLKKIILRSFG